MEPVVSKNQKKEDTDSLDMMWEAEMLEAGTAFGEASATTCQTKLSWGAVHAPRTLTPVAFALRWLGARIPVHWQPSDPSLTSSRDTAAPASALAYGICGRQGPKRSGSSWKSRRWPLPDIHRRPARTSIRYRSKARRRQGGSLRSRQYIRAGMAWRPSICSCPWQLQQTRPKVPGSSRKPRYEVSRSLTFRGVGPGRLSEAAVKPDEDMVAAFDADSRRQPICQYPSGNLRWASPQGRCTRHLTNPRSNWPFNSQ